MKIDKNLKQTNSTFRANWLRMGLICGLIIVSIFNYGCNEDDSYKSPDEYYVKYIVNSSTIYSGRKLKVTINTENNKSKEIVVNQNTKWEVTIGPVSKSFDAKLIAIASEETYGKLKLYSEIHTSKNDSPFAMKVINGSDTPRNSIELNYKIDY